MQRPTKKIAALLAISLAAAGCGQSNEVALNNALAQIEVDEPGAATSVTPTTSTPTTTAVRAVTTSTTVRPTTTTAPSTTSSSTTAALSTTTTWRELVPDVDHPTWDMACALDFGDDPTEYKFKCVPRTPGVSPTLPAADWLGCAGRLDPGTTYASDVGTTFEVVVMAPEGDGVGEHYWTWYPEMSGPNDNLAVAWFEPADTRLGVDRFVSGWYLCFASSFEDGVTEEADKRNSVVSMSVDANLAFGDWNPENGINGTMSLVD